MVDVSALPVKLPVIVPLALIVPTTIFGVPLKPVALPEILPPLTDPTRGPWNDPEVVTPEI